MVAVGPTAGVRRGESIEVGANDVRPTLGDLRAGGMQAEVRGSTESGVQGGSPRGGEVGELKARGERMCAGGVGIDRGTRVVL